MLGNLYIIRNRVNDKVYVGKTYKSVSSRFKDHKTEHYLKDRPLYRAMCKYGFDMFYIEHVGSFPENELENQEIDLIEQLNSFSNGYNATRGGDGRRYCPVSDAAIIDAYQGCKNMAKVARDLKVSGSVVERVLRDINTAKSKPLLIVETGDTFNSTTEAAKALIEADCTRTKNFRSVQKEIQTALKTGNQYLGFTFKARPIPLVRFRRPGSQPENIGSNPLWATTQ